MTQLLIGVDVDLISGHVTQQYHGVIILCGCTPHATAAGEVGKCTALDARAQCLLV